MLHYFPLEHIPNRYTTHLDRDIRKYLDKNGIEYIYYEPKTPDEKDNSVSNGCFLNAVDTVYRQMYQMTQFLANYAAGKVNDGDILFFSDLWNFQVPAFRYLEFFMKKKLDIRGIMWAGAFTDADLVHNLERTYHGFEETILDICSKVYVGTQDFKEDIIRKRYVDPSKIVVSKAPLDFEGLDKFKGSTKEPNLVVFNGRHSPEKHVEMFKMLQKFRPQYKYIDTVGEGVNRVELILGRRSGTGKIENPVELHLRHTTNYVFTNESEVCTLSKTVQVSNAAAEQVVLANNARTFVQQTFAKMGTDESRTTRDQN